MAMDYAANGLAGAYQGGLGQANAIKGEPPRTIASAASRIDELNTRLSKASESLSMISSQIGALNSVGCSPVKESSPPSPSGAVYRLNSSADQAHIALGEIESLIGAIARALG